MQYYMSTILWNTSLLLVTWIRSPVVFSPFMQILRSRNKINLYTKHTYGNNLKVKINSEKFIHMHCTKAFDGNFLVLVSAVTSLWFIWSHLSDCIKLAVLPRDAFKCNIAKYFISLNIVHLHYLYNVLVAVSLDVSHSLNPRTDISIKAKYYYENRNGVLKMINKSSKNKNNGHIYMFNE